MIRQDGFLVPAVSARVINDLAYSFRGLLGLPKEGKICMALAYDLATIKLGDAFQYEVVEDHLMPDDMALTYPDSCLIQIKASVFNGACAGVPRDRFTLAHEVGHLLMHGGLPLHRAYDSSIYKPYRSSEWQADEFAGALLMPESCIDTKGSLESIAYEFGVSGSAAGTRVRNLNRRNQK